MARSSSMPLWLSLICFILLLVVAMAADNGDHGGNNNGNGGNNGNGRNGGNNQGGDNKGGGNNGDGGDNNGGGNNNNNNNNNKGGGTKRVKCDRKMFPFCSIQQPCPPSCPGSCSIDCDACKPVCFCNKPGGVCQDPRFVGGDGITFYFHGKKDRDFCLVSDPNLHINAHFIGRRNAEMKRDFTWVQSIAILFHSHKLSIGAQKTSTWDDAVDRLIISLDGEQVVLPTEEGAQWQAPTGPTVTISRSSDVNGVTVDVDGMFKVQTNVVPITEEESRVHHYGVTADDCFAHLELAFKFYSLTKDVDGVLGQTYKENYVSRVKMSSSMPLMGGVDKFSTSGLYTTDCAVARFTGVGAGIPMVTELADVIKCGSDINGHGIVCKK